MLVGSQTLPMLLSFSRVGTIFLRKSLLHYGILWWVTVFIFIVYLFTCLLFFLILCYKYFNLNYCILRFRPFSIHYKLSLIRWFMANQPPRNFVFGDLQVNILTINIMKKHLYYFEETLIPPMLWKNQIWFCKLSYQIT